MTVKKVIKIKYMMILEARMIIVSLVVVSLVVPLEATHKEGNRQEHCPPSECGLITIKSPFRLKNDPPNCGTDEFELACDENNRTTLSLLSGKYYVKKISYKKNRVRLVDTGLEDSDSCSIPRISFPLESALTYSTETICFVNSPVPIESWNIVNYTNCINSSTTSQTYHYFYGIVNCFPDTVPDLSNITIVYPIPYNRKRGNLNLSISNIHLNLLSGFELYWYWSKRGFYWYNYHYEPFTWRGFVVVLLEISQMVAMSLLARALIGILCMIAYLVYKYRRRHMSLDDSIENFLQSHNNFKPIRYSFSDIKKMTKGFEEKLGKGGYGSVYKAKLRSGHLAAIKLLDKSAKANGQDFISEVATIGRIHHVNVVQLVGFCAEGSKRALVYDFMPNGSLDKFIFSRGENKTPLSWERMYEIALGVARGMEYLHRGCDMQILHFDIKPHNILLDVNFIPKVSDFGLAKLYSTDDSIVSLTAARGTLGYIAPELFYKNIGGVSYKADVYSFGMLLMEIVGRRKNVIPFAEHSSQIYFPSWIYDRINEGEDMELGDVTEELKRLVRKMTLVALWCIQMKPVDRPSMSQVLEMLEGNVELLQVPPKPSFHPPNDPIVDHGTSSLSSSYLEISTTS